MEFRQQTPLSLPLLPYKNRRRVKPMEIGKSYLSENKWTAIRMQKDTLFVLERNISLQSLRPKNELSMNGQKGGIGDIVPPSILPRILIFFASSVYHFLHFIVFEEGRGSQKKIELCLVFYKRVDLVLIGFLCKRPNGWKGVDAVVLSFLFFLPCPPSYIIEKWKTQLEAERDSASSKVGIAKLRVAE
ncbi:hypothetical protein AVEN_196137-1 [Araneus ventricosus]|uniref:Uncharacterized protein n=1 Tax=Araneus ventricosus TaxID=182803 RepID=A0A4Y2E3A0_ARAVE|nr:hypothetical protein AVEN_196137-1 [Araneus ventricosus]